MQAQGIEEEEAGRARRERLRQIFTRVTLPNVKWSLLYGVILCNARRAMGSSARLSVVSGHIRGVTNTVPLHVEVLYGVRVPGLLRGGVAALRARPRDARREEGARWRQQCARRVPRKK